jgi:hypothetical protein
MAVSGSHQHARRISQHGTNSYIHILIETKVVTKPLSGPTVRRPAPVSAGREAAESLALHALAWLAASENLLAEFMSVSGLDLPSLRRDAQAPEFLAGVLDFVLADEIRLRQFCQDSEVALDAPAKARTRLSGGTWEG